VGLHATISCETLPFVQLTLLAIIMIKFPFIALIIAVVFFLVGQRHLTCRLSVKNIIKKMLIVLKWDSFSFLCFFKYSAYQKMCYNLQYLNGLCIKARCFYMMCHFLED
jgi:hypothetical protein